jgi:5-keto 4-deoxyuronate isomerase
MSWPVAKLISNVEDQQGATTLYRGSRQTRPSRECRRIPVKTAVRWSRGREEKSNKSSGESVLYPPGPEITRIRLGIVTLQYDS